MENLKVIIVGTGYVGLVSGICFAEMGHDVTCVDSDINKIDALINNKMPIYEPGLEEMVLRNVGKSRVKFSTELHSCLPKADVVVVAVGTPSEDDGSTNLSYVFEVVKQIEVIKDNAIVVIKSTVPPGTCDKVAELLKVQIGKFVDVVSNPEFLREGNAIEDFMSPDRVVIGCETSNALHAMEKLYSYHIKNGITIINTNRITSELIKYASNTFLAAKVAFINEMSSICERVNANVHDLKSALGSDSRIGPKFLQPGPGFGGSCFPKDISSLIYFSDQVNSNNILVKSIIESNRRRILEVATYVDEIVSPGQTIAVLGLTYKANTDDVRTSPAIDIVKLLLKKYKLKVYDPMGEESAKKILKEEQVEYCRSTYEAASDSSLVMVATEWDEFRDMDPTKMKSDMKVAQIYDVRGVIDSKSFIDAGFKVKIVGMSDGRTV
jgi:UDPglucose 6-dehydrogenase